MGQQTRLLITGTLGAVLSFAVSCACFGFLGVVYVLTVEPATPAPAVAVEEAPAPVDPPAGSEPAPVAPEPADEQSPPESAPAAGSEDAPVEAAPTSPDGDVAFTLPEEPAGQLFMLLVAVNQMRRAATEAQASGAASQGVPPQVSGHLAIFYALNEQLAGPVPDPALQPAWAEAQTVAGAMEMMTQRWLNGEIDTAAALAELETIRQQANQMAATLEAILVAEYDFSQEDVDAARMQARQTFDTALEQVQ